MRRRTSPLMTHNLRCLIDESHQVCSQNILVPSVFFSFSYHDVMTRHFIRELADSLGPLGRWNYFIVASSIRHSAIIPST
jgi:hypothetical protein